MSELNYAARALAVAPLLVFLVLVCTDAAARAAPLVTLLFVEGTLTGTGCSGSGVSSTWLRSFPTAATDDWNEGAGEWDSRWGTAAAAESDDACATFVFVMRSMRSSMSLRPR